MSIDTVPNITRARTDFTRLFLQIIYGSAYIYEIMYKSFIDFTDIYFRCGTFWIRRGQFVGIYSMWTYDSRLVVTRG